MDHFREISPDAERNIPSLLAPEVEFFNQSLLVAKVNDDPEVLAAALAKCHPMRVRPYYLFRAGQ
ncbi:hypothetical protein CO683_39955 [Bradyrhizobium ottawaense]|uniref:hypothetical protein n=1 Tax=Bradyrhizobium ottawaense TaxID=931866 RepID=UPI000BE797EA|nr:hypothetical protein [Bradyrhizobium ottawaense]PDT64154.1 hypothetical protein CO683_39955 [Bradyrhizobium ottawaense]